MSAKKPRKTNQPTHPPLIQKENIFKICSQPIFLATMKKQRYSNIKTLNKKLNRQTPKKYSFFIKNPIKDKGLLHNHKSQTDMSMKNKIFKRPKNLLFHQKSIKDELLLHNHKLQTKIIRQQKIKPLNDQKAFLLYSNIITLNP